jgi:hypothetical protein
MKVFLLSVFRYYVLPMVLAGKFSVQESTLLWIQCQRIILRIPNYISNKHLVSIFPQSDWPAFVLSQIVKARGKRRILNYKKLILQYKWNFNKVELGFLLNNKISKFMRE